MLLVRCSNITKFNVCLLAFHSFNDTFYAACSVEEEATLAKNCDRGKRGHTWRTAQLYSICVESKENLST